MGLAAPVRLVYRVSGTSRAAPTAVVVVEHAANYFVGLDVLVVCDKVAHLKNVNARVMVETIKPIYLGVQRLNTLSAY